MTIAQIIPIPAPPALATFDFADVAEGAGYVTYYGSVSRDTVTDSYILTRDTTAQSNWISTSSTVTGGPTKILDLDFDITFQVPRTIYNIPIRCAITLGGVKTSLTSSNAWDEYAIIKIRKWDGAAETEIVSGTTETLSAVDAASLDIKSKMMFLQIANTAKTHFARGETLRVTVEIYLTVANSRAQAGFAHDPLNRNSTATQDLYVSPSTQGRQIIDDADNTNFIIQIPYIIE